MKNSDKYKENPRRVELIELSVEMRKQRNEGVANAKTQEEELYWASLRINDLIILQYCKQAGTEDFRTFSDWRDAGFKIKKGEKGWVIWAQKRSIFAPDQNPKDKEVKLDEINEDFQFFPICYLFNIFQVEPLYIPSHEEITI